MKGMRVYALMPSENVATFGLQPSPQLLSLEKYRNFEHVSTLLGDRAEAPRTTPADGAKTSLLLFIGPNW